MNKLKQAYLLSISGHSLYFGINAYQNSESHIRTDNLRSDITPGLEIGIGFCVGAFKGIFAPISYTVALIENLSGIDNCGNGADFP
jgi:hypothetical protein